jgi:Uma2 family endonuclease
MRTAITHKATAIKPNYELVRIISQSFRAKAQLQTIFLYNMMIVAQPETKKLTLDEFLQLPETKPASEFINGEVQQKPMPQGEHSLLQIRLGTAINNLTLEKKIAYALPELRCTFGGRSIVPDIAVFEWSRIPRTNEGKIANKFEILPDWIIEILSPEQSANKLIEKIVFCLNHGTKLAWLIDPDHESITIWQPNQLPEIKSGDQSLTVLDIISEGNLVAKNVFEWLKL